MTKDRNSPNYRRTKLKELCSGKRKYIRLGAKHETHTKTGVKINKNGKPII